MTSPFDLDGKVALVTGANTGLGQAIALALAQAGADIVAVGRSAPDETRAGVREAGRRGEWIDANLDDSTGVGAIVDAAVAKFGAIDILVNNAGIIRRDDALDFTEDDWDAVMDVNLKTAFFLSQAAARWWVAQQRGGKIINIASMLSFQGGIRVPSYTASKSGLPASRACSRTSGRRGHQRQRDRARLFRDQQHRRRCAPTKRNRDPRPHSGGALGRAGRPRRRGGVPRIARVRLRARRDPAGRRRLAGALIARLSPLPIGRRILLGRLPVHFLAPLLSQE